MASPAPPPTSQFIVQGDDVASAPFAAHIEADPGVATRERIARDAIVLEMSSDATARLRARFGPTLRIEPNSDLTPPL